MAKASSSAKKEKEKDKGKVSPFKTRKSKVETTQSSDTLTPPQEVAQAIDAFREAQEQAKHFEGEATIHKDVILNYSEREYSKRLLKGMNDSFKILGEETMVTYVVMDAGAGLTEEDTEDFAKRWGKAAAEELIVRDYASIRFDGKVLEAHYDAVVAALQSLPEDVLENLFKPMLMKARPGAAEAAKRYAKNPDDLRELLKQLRIKNYIR
ncbi:MAG TPA: hypothetical protein VL588_05435 [Bdellovibrionota bacterium]|nr:hypothetical protein [Bdellovibrionota bacterium]